jgi:threonine synthase
MTEILCTNCHRPYPEQGIPYRCPSCGGIYDYASSLSYDPDKIEPNLPGIWRYRHSFGLPVDAPIIHLGEGNTPLVWAEAYSKQVAFKLESLNPTGSFKDRGSAPLVSFLKSRGAVATVEDSSGNAGASFAAYAVRAGILARIYMPDSASGPKRRQIEAYGAEVVRIIGPRSNAADAVRRATDAGAVYASHAYLPFNLPGYATIAYELVEQLGQAPGTVISPVGQGGLLLGIARGFAALKQANCITNIPVLVGVQARACAPLWALFAYGQAGLALVSEETTLAEGVRVSHPLRGDLLLRTVEACWGLFVAVNEEDILPGRDELTHRGLYVEPTSAIVWNGLKQVITKVPEPIVVLLTGNGLKSDQ